MFHYGNILNMPGCFLMAFWTVAICLMIFWTCFFAKLYCNTCRFSTTVIIVDCLPFASLVKLLQLNCISSQYCFSAVVTTFLKQRTTHWFWFWQTFSLVSLFLFCLLRILLFVFKSVFKWNCLPSKSLPSHSRLLFKSEVVPLGL